MSNMDTYSEGVIQVADKKILQEMGARIRMRRRELNITQEQLAEQMDVSTQMVSNLELGKKAIRPENLIKVCEALDTSADYLLRGKYIVAGEPAICAEISGIPEKYRKPIEMLIHSFNE